MTVQFKDHRFSDRAYILSLEEIYRLYGSWSDLHDFSFDSLISVPTTTITGITASKWTTVLQSSTLPPNFVVEYDKTDTRQGLLIQHSSGGINFLVTTNSSGYIEIYENLNLVQSIPRVIPNTATMKVVFTQQLSPDDETIIWRSISVYVNDSLYTVFTEKWTLAYSNIKVGMAAYDTDVITYTNLRVPELCDIAEFGTLDPGENPISGLQRTTDGRYLKSFIRFDGTLRAWKVKSIASVLTLPAGTFERTEVPTDLTNFYTHIRMVGAYLWSEFIDTTLATQYQHRFQEVNNPMLLTKQECFVEAQNTIKRLTEDAFTENVEFPVNPLLEVEDRITTPEGDWIITEYSLDLAFGEIIQSANLRKYVWN